MEEEKRLAGGGHSSELGTSTWNTGRLEAGACAEGGREGLDKSPVITRASIFADNDFGEGGAGLVVNVRPKRDRIRSPRGDTHSPDPIKNQMRMQRSLRAANLAMKAADACFEEARDPPCHSAPQAWRAAISVRAHCEFMRSVTQQVFCFPLFSLCFIRALRFIACPHVSGDTWSKAIGLPLKHLGWCVIRKILPDISGSIVCWFRRAC